MTVGKDIAATDHHPRPAVNSEAKKDEVKAPERK